MVSADHFAHELRAQLNRATKHGSIDIVINSGELYRSLGGYTGSMHGMPACCDAMQRNDAGRCPASRTGQRPRNDCSLSVAASQVKPQSDSRSGDSAVPHIIGGVGGDVKISPAEALSKLRILPVSLRVPTIGT
jgi:hypothetical protein